MLPPHLPALDSSNGPNRLSLPHDVAGERAVCGLISAEEQGLGAADAMVLD
jgi:hypothetical protein